MIFFPGYRKIDSIRVELSPARLLSSSSLHPLQKALLSLVYQAGHTWLLKLDRKIAKEACRGNEPSAPQECRLEQPTIVIPGEMPCPVPLCSCLEREGSQAWRQRGGFQESGWNSEATVSSLLTDRLVPFAPWRALLTKSHGASVITRP